MKCLAGIISVLMLCLVMMPLQAQDVTPAPEKPDFAFSFPLEAPTDAQIQEAFNCALSRESPEATLTPSAQHKPTGCELARQVVALAASRSQDTDPTDDEVALFKKMMSLNPALALDLSIISSYYTLPLVEPPDFTNQSITDSNIRYTFGGLGGSADYTIHTITRMMSQPFLVPLMQAVIIRWQQVSRQRLHAIYRVQRSMPASYRHSAQPCVICCRLASSLAALLAGITIPTGKLIWTSPITVVHMVTNSSNVVGIGGPWQTEIDGQNYMQYSGAFSQAIGDLFDALKLDFGQTAAMGCGGLNNPLEDAFEIKTSG